ncbi:FecR family protein [Tamlana sp. 2201CG12-4]|uniref:FecR family protein n=1 Tax=Tamlana sp. 2201CG12-4 TaxID=3112582 RepID=UPI002DB92567|nr:FecR family protein [Tamlana sp. 2201CG12-4]MEC3908230.1 FecR family protein [Tamlana sp. 2201CG12-4]
MNDIFRISRLIIKKKLKVLTDSEKADLEKLNQKHSFSNDVKIEDLVDKVSSYSTINKDKAWEAIEAKSRKTQSKSKSVFKLFDRTWHKYAAAAVLVGVLATAYFFKDNLLDQVANDADTPIIVNTNTIEPGTNKATLTLEDNSQIALEKGESYQTSNVNSDGEQIVYQAGDNKESELLYHYLTIPRGGQYHIVLSDGTKVWLNSETQLKYPKEFLEGQNRQVELVYGEAYFDVTPSTENKGSKFIVLNESQKVEVLGTAFNIKAYKDESHIYTTLVEGKVAVDYEEKSQNLKPSQQSVLDVSNHTISVIKVDVKDEVSWKDGIFCFRNKPLKDIMKVISRWYDVDVVFESKALEEITFKGVLGKDQDLEEILETIKTLSIIKNYKINGKIITLE